MTKHRCRTRWEHSKSDILLDDNARHDPRSPSLFGAQQHPCKRSSARKCNASATVHSVWRIRLFVTQGNHLALIAHANSQIFLNLGADRRWSAKRCCERVHANCLRARRHRVLPSLDRESYHVMASSASMIDWVGPSKNSVLTWYR